MPSNRAGWDKAIAAIVLTGAGSKAFCTGAAISRPMTARPMTAAA